MSNPTARRLQIQFDNAAGINGVLDTQTGKFVGHTQSTAGCQILRRNIERRMGIAR